MIGIDVDQPQGRKLDVDRDCILGVLDALNLPISEMQRELACKMGVRAVRRMTAVEIPRPGWLDARLKKSARGAGGNRSDLRKHRDDWLYDRLDLDERAVFVDEITPVAPSYLPEEWKEVPILTVW